MMAQAKRKPLWLNKKINLSACAKVKRLLKELNLRTVCEESFCPNISECFHSGIATFMILGDTCTRSCSFCAVRRGRPGSVDKDEPQRIKKAVKLLNLNHVVITSPTRDDLSDGGANMFVRVVEGLKSTETALKVEILIPDFLGNSEIIKKIAQSGADIVAHNLETVPSLYIKVRKEADYSRSLGVLRSIKQINSKMYTKSGIMLGLGEQEPELIEVFRDLREVNCDFLTLGQYLSPSLQHYPVKEYISPEKFAFLEKKALKFGFKGVKSSPYVRSSYYAHTFLKTRES
jgi:lipoic acid synthetase